MKIWYLFCISFWITPGQSPRQLLLAFLFSATYFKPVRYILCVKPFTVLSINANTCICASLGKNLVFVQNFACQPQLFWEWGREAPTRSPILSDSSKSSNDVQNFAFSCLFRQQSIQPLWCDLIYLQKEIFHKMFVVQS